MTLEQYDAITGLFWFALADLSGETDLVGDLKFCDFLILPTDPAYFRQWNQPTYRATPGLGRGICVADEFNFCKFAPCQLFPLRDVFLCDLLLRHSNLEQFIEKGAVVHHRLAQLLGIRRALLIAHRDGLCRPVIGYDIGVVD